MILAAVSLSALTHTDRQNDRGHNVILTINVFMSCVNVREVMSSILLLLVSQLLRHDVFRSPRVLNTK